MTCPVGILATGGYVPRLRLRRAAVAAAHAWFAPGLDAVGTRAMANWDEDAITMAVEAARDCLGDRPRADLSGVVLASTSFPFADRQNAGVVKEALNLADEVGAMDVGGSQRAGTTALLNTLQGAVGGGGPVLCLAAERRRARPGSEAELVQGDAAAALLVGSGDPIALFLGGHSETVDFVDHYRRDGAAFDYGWESRWLRDEGYGRIVPQAIAAALRKLDLQASDIDRLVMAAPLKGVDTAVARAAGLPTTAVRDALSTRVGAAGCAHPLLLLAHALEEATPGEMIMMVGFGQGCDVLVFEVQTRPSRTGVGGVSGWLARGCQEDNYLKFLAFAGLLDLDRGMRAEHDQKTPLTALYRNRRAVLGLVGSRCLETGAVQFPPSDIKLDGMPGGAREAYPLAERPARILTYTADSLAFTPDPPAYYGAVAFEGGGRLTTEFTDMDPGDVEVGRLVRMTFRIKAVDERRGFIKYFWKAAPALASAADPAP